MSIGKFLKAFISLILSCVMLTLCVSAATNTYKSYFSHAGLSEADGAEFMRKCIVMRVGNCEGYIDNKRVYLFEGNKAVRAINEDGEICVPIRFVLSGLGVEFTKTDSSLSFEYNGRKITLSDGDLTGCFVSNSQLYASVEKIASILSLDLHIEGEFAFMSTTQGIFDEGIPESVMSKLSQYLGYEWQYLNMGKALGYITGVYVHPKNPDLMYATGDVCGMFKWDPETETWLDCNRDSFEYDNCNFTNSMGSIALDPSNENVIYAVFGNDSVDRGSEGSSIDIFKSEDYGDSWTRCFFEKPMCAYSARTRWATAQMAVDPNNPNIIYAGTRFDGLWKSEKGAEAGSWCEVNGIPKGPVKDELADSSGVAAIVFDPESPVINGRTSVMYVSVLGYGVYKSSDCGETFTLMSGSPKIGAQCMRFINGHIYMAGASSKLPEELKEKYEITPGVFKYDGKAWNNITPTKSEPWYNSIAVNPENENELFVFREGWATGGMNCRSLDGGRTWEEFPHWKDSICMGTALFAKYKGENVVYLPYGAGMYRLSNLYGKIEDVKVEEISEGFDLLCIFSMRSVPSKKAPQLLMAVADFGQYAINDFYSGGYRVTGWQQNSFGMAYCYCDPSIVINSGSQTQKGGKGYIDLSTDYGNTYVSLEGWNSANAPVSLAISATKQENGYPIFMAYSATGQKGIHRSLDMGKTWEYVLPLTTGEGTANGRALASDCVDGKTFYMLLANGTFYTTTDGGENWKIAHTFSGLTTWPQTTKAVPNVENAVWVNGRKDGIYTTADGGYTWEKLPDVGFCYAFGFGRSKEGEKTPTAYMYGIYKGHESVYMSDNLGKTWKDIGNPGTNPGWCSDIEGDANVYGRLYIGCKSLLCGQIAGSPNDDGMPVINLDNQNTAYSLDRISADRNYKVSGSISKKAAVTVNGNFVDVSGDNSFVCYTELKDGDNIITVDAVDETGQNAKTVTLSVTYDPS
ncbi:MAG: hypothetical protein IJO52_05490, partial [Clostridia bacterium]|nr:hypothetical protein [Clostridia bacterium]